MSPAIRIAALLLFLVTAGIGELRAQSVSGPRLPAWAELSGAGLDVGRPLSVRLEWTTPDTPPQVDAVSAVLARYGFTVERSRLTSAGGQPLSHTLSAARVERIRPDWLKAFAQALQPLLAGDGASGMSWTVAAPPPAP